MKPIPARIVVKKTHKVASAPVIQKKPVSNPDVYMFLVPDGQTAFRLTLEETQNKTDRKQNEVDTIVRTAFADKIRALNETGPGRNTKANSGDKPGPEPVATRDYHLQVTVEPPLYQQEKLTIIVRVIVSAFPGANIEGEFVPRFTQADTLPVDITAENELIKKAIEQAVDSFGKYIAAR